MSVKHFGCTAIHNKTAYKCFIHSFIHSYNPLYICVLLSSTVTAIGLRLATSLGPSQPEER